jgi:uncharacterized protein (TIGR02145 family)
MKLYFTFLATILLTSVVFAQTPERMSYQAVIRDAGDNLISNQTVGMQISILQGAAGGTAVYIETQAPTTNDNGLVSFEIGTGTTSDDFSSIDWANGPYFIKTETDLAGGTSYTFTGTSQLISVPYALHAKTAATVTGEITETDPSYTSSEAANITATDITNLSNLSGVNTGDQNLSGIATNTQAIKDTASQIRNDIPDVSGFLTSESDPAYSGSEAANITTTDITNLSNLSGVNTGDQNLNGIATNTQAIQDTAGQIRADFPDVSGFISSETDPTYSASEAANITATHITNLGNLSGINTGDQDISGIAINEQAIQDTASQIRADFPDVSGFISSETDPTYSASEAANITATHITNLGNLSGINTGDQNLNGIATNTQAIKDTSNQIRADFPDVSGFVSTESDPIYSGSEAANITATDITNLSNLSGVNTGDQNLNGIATNTQAIKDTASQIRNDIPDVSGFLTSESDPVFDVSVAAGITTTDITFWNNKKIPIYTNSEILNLTPENGDALYNSTENLYQIYYNNSWVSFPGTCWPMPTTANAGPDQNFDNATLTATLAANTPETDHGTGAWSIISGTGGSFADATSPTTTFTGTNCIAYTLRWTITTACNNSTDDVAISFNQTPTTANAGTNQNFYNATLTATLAANTPETDHGTGAWSIISGTGGSFADATSPSTTFTGTNCTAYTLRWTITASCDNSTDDVAISFNQTPTTANAGPDQSFTDATLTVTLAANTPVTGHGTGAWNIVSGTGGSFADATSPTTTFTGTNCTAYTLRWTITTACDNSTDDVAISFNQTPTTANAGSDQIYTDGRTSSALSANAPEANHGNGTWSIVSGTGGSFSDASSPTATFTGSPKTQYELKWTIATTCGNSPDNVNIFFWQNGAGSPVVDVEGNSYNTVWIGTQLWLSENLKTTKYNDNTNIPLISNTADWLNSTTAAYCWYNNEISNKDIYGALYRWEVVNTGKLCPEGWHVPSDAEWTILTDYLTNNGFGFEGSGDDIAKALAAKTNWMNYSILGAPGNDQASNNSSGFSALPGGYRNTDGSFYYNTYACHWWSATEGNTDAAWRRYLRYDTSAVRRDRLSKGIGFSLRCVRD